MTGAGDTTKGPPKTSSMWLQSVGPLNHLHLNIFEFNLS